MRIVRVYAVTYELSNATDNIHSCYVEIDDTARKHNGVSLAIDMTLFVQLGHADYNILSYVYMSDKGY